MGLPEDESVRDKNTASLSWSIALVRQTPSSFLKRNICASCDLLAAVLDELLVELGDEYVGCALLAYWCVSEQRLLPPDGRDG